MRHKINDLAETKEPRTLPGLLLDSVRGPFSSAESDKTRLEACRRTCPHTRQPRYRCRDELRAATIVTARLRQRHRPCLRIRLALRAPLETARLLGPQGLLLSILVTPTMPRIWIVTVVNRRAKLTPYRRPKLTPLVVSRSGPEPTELITEWRRVRP